MDVLVPVLGSAAGIVAGLAALTYVLGLLALWIPISRTYTDGLASAWYATSLIPRTMVAGVSAAKLLAQASLAFVLLSTLPLGIYAVAAYVVRRQGGYRGVAMGLTIIGVGGLLVMLITALVVYRMQENLTTSPVIVFVDLVGVRSIS